MWKTASSKEIFNHPRLTLIEDEIILPNGHKISYLRFKDDGSCAVTIIAKRDGKILLQREYAYPPNQKLFQFPGGAVSANEKPEEGANRELMEEMSYRANKLELLGSYLIDNRRSAQKMYVFLGSDLVEESLEKDTEEEIESFWFSEDEIARMIKNGKIINVHSLASWCVYKN
ncbi:MAG: NUDIX hydrolase [Parcubacteria group bacterium]